MAVGFKEGKVADSPGGILPSLPSPRPLSQQPALQLDTVDNIVVISRNNDSTASSPDKGQEVSPSTSQTASASKFVPSFGKKGPSKSRPKKINMPAAKSQSALPQSVTSSNDGDTSSPCPEGPLAVGKIPQGDATKQTTETQAAKVSCLGI